MNCYSNTCTTAGCRRGEVKMMDGTHTFVKMCEGEVCKCGATRLIKHVPEERQGYSPAWSVGAALEAAQSRHGGCSLVHTEGRIM